METIKSILFIVGFVLVCSEPIVGPIIGLVCWWICYILDDGQMFYK